MGLRRNAAAALGALVLSGILGATISGASSTSTTLAGQGGIRILNGGTVIVAVPHLPTQFNPLTPGGSNAVTQMVMEQVLPQVFVTGPNMEVRGSLGLVISAEVTGLKPQTVVYTLAKGARWSDGVPITAADFAYDWKRLLTIGASLPATFPLAGYRDITSVTGSRSAKLGTTVTVVFAQALRRLDGALRRPRARPHRQPLGLGGGVFRDGAGAPRLGGPVRDHEDRSRPKARAVAQPLLLGAARPSGPHRFQGDGVRGRDAARACVRGRVDLAALAPGAGADGVVTGSTDLEQTISDSATLWQLDFNLADPVTGQLTVRQAIAVAINRPEVVADSIGLLVPDATTAANRVYAAHQPGGRSDDGAYLTPDDTEAVQLLATAGYPLSAEGIATSASGTPLVLTLTGPKGNATVVAAEAEIQSQLLQVGIELQIRNVARSVLLSTDLPQGRYQLALAPYLESPFPSTMARLYTKPVGPTPTPVGGTSPTIPPRSGVLADSEREPSAANAGAVTRDVLGYDDAVVDRLFAEARSELNAETDTNLYNQIDTLLWQDLPTLPSSRRQRRWYDRPGS